jgi:hypothetical protein
MNYKTNQLKKIEEKNEFDEKIKKYFELEEIRKKNEKENKKQIKK